jgi:ribosomal-protein-alanine N-acetyltransferase
VSLTSCTATHQRQRIPKWRFVDDSAQMCGFIIEAMRPSDLPEVLAIERRSFASPWSRADFEAELEKTYAGLSVARLRGGGEGRPVLGYLCYWLVAGEIQITNLAVHLGYRRHGVGRGLLLQACGRGYSAGARLAVLEVRESNKGARALYESLGFVAVQKRPRYYTEYREDALVMVLHLDRKWSQQWQPRI